jgi:hypothetical protein
MNEMTTTTNSTTNHYLISILKDELTIVNDRLDRLYDTITSLGEDGYYTKNFTEAFGYFNREQGRLEEEIYKLTH